MNITRIISITLFLLTLAVAPASAESGRSHGKGMQDDWGPRLQRMQLILDLTQEQQERIGAILQTSHARMQPLKQQARLNRQEMQQLKRAATFDETRARELARQQADNRVSMMAQKHSTRQQIDAALTEDQLKKKNQLRELRHQKGQKHAWKHDSRPKGGSRHGGGSHR